MTQHGGGRPFTDSGNYDRMLVATSGGKDSKAALTAVLESGIAAT